MRTTDPEATMATVPTVATGWSPNEAPIATRLRMTFTCSTPNTARYIQVINRGNAERWKKLKLTFTHAGGTHEYTTDEATAWASGLGCYENSNCSNRPIG